MTKTEISDFHFWAYSKSPFFKKKKKEKLPKLHGLPETQLAHFSYSWGQIRKSKLQSPCPCRWQQYLCTSSVSSHSGRCQKETWHEVAHKEKCNCVFYGKGLLQPAGSLDWVRCRSDPQVPHSWCELLSHLHRCPRFQNFPPLHPRSLCCAGLAQLTGRLLGPFPKTFKNKRSRRAAWKLHIKVSPRRINRLDTTKR